MCSHIDMVFYALVTVIALSTSGVVVAAWN